MLSTQLCRVVTSAVFFLLAVSLVPSLAASAPTSAPVLVSSSSSWSSNVSCATPGYDFSPLFGLDFTYVDPYTGTLYSVSPCGAVQSTLCQFGGMQSELCQQFSNGTVASAFPHSPSQSYNLSAQLQYSLSRSVCGDVTLYMVVSLVCNATVGSAVVSRVGYDSCGCDACSWRVEIGTPYACAGPSASNRTSSSSSSTRFISSTSAPTSAPVLVSSSSSWSSNVSCATPGYDFSPLFGLDFTYVDPYTGTLYSVSPCGAVQSTLCQFGGMQSELCQQFSNGTVASAFPHSPSQSYNLSAQLQYSLSRSVCGDVTLYMVVSLVCNATVGSAVVSRVGYDSCGCDACSWRVEIGTPYACAGPSASNRTSSSSSSTRFISSTSAPTSAPVLVSSSSSWSSNVSCATPGYDFSPLFGLDFTYVDPYTGTLYSVSPCGAVQSTLCQFGGMQSELCQQFSNGTVASAFPHSPSQSYNLSAQLQYSLSRSVCGDVTLYMVVSLVCNATVGSAVVSRVGYDSCGCDACSWRVEIGTPYACAGPSASNRTSSSSSSTRFISSTSAPTSAPVLVSSSSSWSSNVSCATPGYDFSPLFGLDFTYVDPYTGTLYSVSPCGAVQSTLCQFGGMQSELCQQFSNGTVASAFPHSPSQSYNLSAQLQYSLSRSVCGDVTLYMVVSLVCNATVGSAVVSRVGYDSCGCDACSWRVEIGTPYACAGPSASNRTSSSSSSTRFISSTSAPTSAPVLVSSSSSWSSNVSCATPGYDFSPLFGLDFTYVDPYTGTLYSVSPCGAVQSTLCQFGGMQSELCQQFSNGTVASAFPHSPSQSYNLSAQLQYSLSRSVCGDVTLYMVVSLVCNATVGSAVVSRVGYDSCGCDACSWRVEIGTPYACAGPSASNRTSSSSSSTRFISSTSAPTSAPVLVSSSSSWSSNVSCATPGYDFSPLFGLDFTYVDPYTGTLYSVSPCGAVQSTLCQFGGMQSELCQQFSNGTVASAFPHSPSQSYNLSAQLQYSLSRSVCGDVTLYMVVSLVCNATVGSAVVSRVGYDSCGCDACSWRVEIGTPYACAGPSASNRTSSSSSSTRFISSTSAPTSAPVSISSSSSSLSRVSCSTPGYDFTSIRSLDLPYFNSSAGILYTVHPCGAVVSPLCQFGGTQTELCAQLGNGTVTSVLPHKPSQYYDVFGVSGQWAYIVGVGGCGGSGLLEVSLVCNMSVSAAVVNYVRYDDCDCGSCWWHVEIATQYACPNMLPAFSSSSPASYPQSSSSSSLSPRMLCSMTAGYDLSPIEQQDLVFYDAKQQVLYTFRPCGPVLSPLCQFDNNQTELCQQFSNGTVASAFPHNASLPYALQYSDGLLSYDFGTGGTDNATCGYGNQSLSVEFGCDLGTVATISSVQYTSDTCGWSVVVDTMYACPGVWFSSSSSTGPRVTPCANNQVDLLPLSSETDLTLMTDDALFILHPCSSVRFAECAGASLCLITGNGNVTRLVDYERWLPSSTFPLTTHGNFPPVSTYTYTDNSTCIFRPDIVGRSVRVEFVCDQFAVPARLTNVATDWACQYVATVNSTYACPTQVSPWLSSSSSMLPYSSTSSSRPVLPSSCANAQYNFSSLSNQTDFALVNHTTDSFFVFHPCSPVQYPYCLNSTLCIQYPNNTVDVLVGYNSHWQSANYTLSTHTAADGETYSYYFFTDESEQCVFEGLAYPRQALVLFYCNESVLDGAVLQSVELQEPHPVTVPCHWKVTMQTALACSWTSPSSLSSNTSPSVSSSPPSPTSTGSSPLPPPVSGASFDLSLLASFAVVLLSACLLVILLIVYRVRARRLLPYSSAMAMHNSSTTGTQSMNDSYVRMA